MFPDEKLIDVTVTCKTKIIENFDANNKSLFVSKDFNNKQVTHTY